MKVDTMRKIDYLAGLPLCFVATWLLKLFAARRTTQPKNVLLIELSEMGSTILADPAMQKLKKVFDANLHFVIFAKNKPSLDLLGTVPQANIFTIREDGLIHLALDTLKFLQWTRKRNIDTVIDLELFSRFTALLSGFCGAANQVGFYKFHTEGLYRGGMLTHRVAYNPHIHIAKNFIALVNALSAGREELPYSKTLIGDEEVALRTVSYSAEQQEGIRAKIRALYPGYDMARHQLVLINPNASELLIQRRWMPEHFVTLMQTVLARYDNALVLITGAPSEGAEAEDLRRRVAHERCINFTGQVTLTELTILYSISKMMVTNDSGPGHFSSVTTMPTFVLFGPETPKLYGSLGNSTPIYAGLACSPCVSAANHRKTPCSDNVCLQVIKPEFVFEQIRPVLES